MIIKIHMIVNIYDVYNTVSQMLFENHRKESWIYDRQCINYAILPLYDNFQQMHINNKKHKQNKKMPFNMFTLPLERSDVSMCNVGVYLMQFWHKYHSHKETATDFHSYRTSQVEINVFMGI